MLKMSEIDDGNFNTTLAKLKAKPAMGMAMLLIKRSGCIAEIFLLYCSCCKQNRIIVSVGVVRSLLVL